MTFINHLVASIASARRPRRRRGSTLLETILAMTIAASAIVLGTTFALNGMAIGNDITAQQDFNAGFRRVQREFVGDVQQATRFHFGYTDDDKVNVRIATPLAEQQELIFGYTNAAGQDVWIHYTAKASASTGSFYLLKTSNEQDGVNFQTTVLAPEVEGVTFTFYDSTGAEAQMTSQIRRVDMTLSLASANVKRETNFIGVLRGQNEGAARLPGGIEFDVIEDANFLR